MLTELWLEKGDLAQARLAGEIDHGTQLAAMHMFCKITGSYAPVSVEHSGTITHELTDREKLEARETLEAIGRYAREVPLLEEENQ